MKRPVWLALWGFAGLALPSAACEHRCPPGYDKRGDTCYRIRDAGADAGSESDSNVGDGVEMEDAGNPVTTSDAGEAPSRASAGDGGVHGDDVRTDEGGDAASESASCALKCDDHQVCHAKDGSEQCTCAMGYSACGADVTCVDVKTDPLNCGSCGYACAEGLSCKQGECEQRIRELVLDDSVSCALYDSPDGNYPLKCWGDGQYGLFRDGTKEALTPRQVSGVSHVRALAMIGKLYCMVVPGEDNLRCWTEGRSSSDVFLRGIRRVSGAGAERYGISLCALHGVGDVSCWGTAQVNGTGEDRTWPQSPIDIENHRVFRQLDSGSIHSCAVSSDGRVACWGAIGTEGSAAGSNLGVPAESFAVGATWSSGVFVQKEGGGSLTGVTKVAVGSTTCAVTEAGELWCWGPNRGSWRTPSGLLGVGDEKDHWGAVKVALDDVVDVALGWGAQACALERNGQVYCWGSADFSGQGAGAAGNVMSGHAFNTPQAVPDLSDAVEIQAGAGHTCVRRRSGHIMCWGLNLYGELGDGTKVQRLSPTPVIGLYE